MNRLTITAVALGILCSLAGPSAACTYPDVHIWDWTFYVSPGQTVDILAEDYSGTEIEDWSWTWPPEAGMIDSSQEDYFGLYGTSTLSISFANTGSWQIDATATNNFQLEDSDYARVHVITVTINSATRFIRSGSTEVADIYYTILPSTGWFRYAVTLYIKDQFGSTIRTQDLTSLGLGAQHTTWDGKKNDGYPAPPADYTAVVEIKVGPYGSIKFSDSKPIAVASLGIVVDTVILPMDLEGDGPGLDHYAQLQVNAIPVSLGGQVEVSTSNLGVRIWDGSSWFTGSRTFPVPLTGMAVDGITPGPVTIFAKWEQGTIAEDYRNIQVTETVSHCPLGTDGHVWIPSNENELPADDGYTFERELELQGYNVTWYRDDNSFDDAWPECTRAHYKSLANDGALHFIGYTPGYSVAPWPPYYPWGGGYGAAYAQTEDGARTWIGSEPGMRFAEASMGGQQRYIILVDDNWHAQNFASGLNDMNAIVHWAFGFSSGIKEAAGGRWRIGYSGAMDVGGFDGVTRKLLQRMNGTDPDYSATRRTAGEAQGGGGFPVETQMDGNAWTTLCPAPMEVLPQSPPLIDGYYWCGIIFDTYMDTTVSANDALPLPPGYNKYWSGETGYGEYALGFDYTVDNGQGHGTATADADFCTDGSKKMDGDRVAPNADDRTWQY